MTPVSIETFIRVVYAQDDHPPSLATIRRRCPDLPGAFRDGRRWRIDLDRYYEVMERRIKGYPEDDRELAFLQNLAASLQ